MRSASFLEMMKKEEVEDEEYGGYSRSFNLQCRKGIR